MTHAYTSPCKSECITTTIIAMTVSYSVDLRWRVIWMILGKKKSIDEVSELCCISKSNIRQYMRFKQTGEVKPSDYQHRPCKLLNNHNQLTLL